MHRRDGRLMSNRDIAKSKPQPFLEIFERYQEQIFNFILRMTQDCYLAEDLTQEVFLKLFQSESNLSRHPNPGAWVFTIARNMCLNALRNRRSKIGHQNIMQNAAQEISVHGNDPYHDLVARETADLVKKALAELNENQREVLILREYHDLPYRKIAKITQSSEGRVKSLLFRARETLRKKLQTSRR